MSNFRRNLMLANSMLGGGDVIYDEVFGEIPPESTEFGWPLYITIPYQETDSESGNRIYYKEPSDIASELWNWCMENKVLVDETAVPVYEAYPSELYINGVRVNMMSANDELFQGITVWSIDFGSILFDSTLSYDYSIDMIVYQS